MQTMKGCLHKGHDLLKSGNHPLNLGIQSRVLSTNVFLRTSFVN